MKAHTTLASFMLLALGAVCQQSVQIPSEIESETRMKEQIAELQRSITFDKDQSIRHVKTFTESTCAYSVLRCPGGTVFTENKEMMPLVATPNGDGNKVYGGRFKYQEDNYVNMTVFFKREVLRRARNFQKANPIVMTRERTNIKIDTTTTGWTVGAQLNLGSWNPATGGTKGVSVSASYSSETIKSTHVSVSDSATISCPPLSACWTEAWTGYVLLKGVCKMYPEVSCANKVDPCTTIGKNWQLPNTCEQVTQWRDRICKPEEIYKECEVVTPLMEGERPYLIEVFFSNPIPELQRPKITGYKGGVYLLGSEDYIYAPDHGADRYWTPTKGWHINNEYPNLDADVAAFKLEVPEVKCLHASGNCLLLSTDEWYCLDKDSEERLYFHFTPGPVSYPKNDELNPDLTKGPQPPRNCTKAEMEPKIYN
ncbi:hypothetical protein CDD81_6417 [Ophiocordyceps australis]|uniref:Uncharacterized protein n=1 Tax=Ophiocordyceps australis TaxID=1399860 RepID=A0A2C5Y6X0_9HYPO|nr:hypothetical protein CDD81_6417 [Ophiocordyceps australis]